MLHDSSPKINYTLSQLRPWYLSEFEFIDFYFKPSHLSEKSRMCVVLILWYYRYERLSVH